MGSYKNSKMYRSKKENNKFVEDAAKLFKQKRNAGDKTNYIDVNKNEAKKFNLFRFIKKKHTKTGRFGAEEIKDREDSISALDKEGEKTGEPYFDPFALKIIIPKDDKDENKVGQDIEKVNEDDEDDEDYKDDGDVDLDKYNGMQSGLINDFIARVDEQIDLSKRNDFEKQRAGINSRLGLGQGITKKDEENGLSEEDKNSYNAGKSFKSDIGLKEKVPDNFAVRIAVDHPPATYSHEYTQFKAKETKGLWSKIKGLFFKSPKEEDLIKKFAKTLPEYKQILNLGKAEAAQAGMKYNEEEDPNIQLFFVKLKEDVTDNSTGHAGVKMIAKKGGEELSEYSFGFVPAIKSGVAGAVTGQVTNPDSAGSAKIHDEAAISHSNYLRAAARIRGIVGSMRTYSMIGYNCTSFAMDIANTAGMKLKNEASSDIVMTHRHYSQRVDSPYTLAKNLKNGQKPDIRRYVVMENTNFSKKPDEEKVAPKKIEALKKELIPILTNMPTVTEISRVNKQFKDMLTALFEDYMKKILIKGAEIDYLFPVANLKGPELAEAQMTRTDYRIREFGVATEEEYLNGLLKDEDKLFEILFNTNNIYSMKDVLEDDYGYSERDKMIEHIVNSKFMSTYYPGIKEPVGWKIAEKILEEMRSAQKDIIESNRKKLKYIKGTELVKKIMESAQRYGGSQMIGYAMFGEIDFNDTEAVKKFLDSNNIALPKISEELDTNEVEEPTILNVPAKISEDDIDDMVLSVKNVSVKAFKDVFAGPMEIEGYVGSRMMSYENVAAFLNSVRKEKNALKAMAIHYATMKTEQDQERKEEIFKNLLEAVLGSLSESRIKKIFKRLLIN